MLTDAALDQDKDELQRLDDAVRKNVLRGSLVRVKIWSADGTIVYSDESQLIGQRFTLDDEKREVFDGAAAVAHVTNLSEAENQYESETKLLEVPAVADQRRNTGSAGVVLPLQRCHRSGPRSVAKVRSDRHRVVDRDRVGADPLRLEACGSSEDGPSPSASTSSLARRWHW